MAHHEEEAQLAATGLVHWAFQGGFTAMKYLASIDGLPKALAI